MIIHKLNLGTKSAYTILIIIIASFTLGYAVPGIIAFNEKVYFEKDLKHKFLSIYVNTLSEQRKEVVEYDVKIKKIDSTISRLESKLLKDTSHTLNDLEILKYYQVQKGKIKKPIIFRPFYLNQLMFFWAFIFLTFSIIIFFISPIKLKQISDRKNIYLLLSLFVLFYPTYRFPSWLRNLPEGQMDAKSIYYANLNFAPFSFYYQEFEALIVTLLLCTIMVQFITLYHIKKKEFDNCEKGYFERLFDFNYIDTLTSSFLCWQFSSIFLLPTFIWYATYYWNNVILNHDNRYILPAIIIHSIIIVAWLTITLPLLITWYEFNKNKLIAKKDILFNTSLTTEEKTFLIGQIESIKPIGLWNLTLSAASIIFSFIFPLLGVLK